MQMKQSGCSANLPKAMIFKSHCERHHGLQFQVRVSLQPWVLSSQAQRQCSYWVAQAVHWKPNADSWSNPHPGLQDLGRNRSQETQTVVPLAFCS